jgi:hypothetical membrane protein
MDAVNPNRLRGGAVAWLLTLQFFVVEAIAQSRVQGSYSRVHDVISSLGATTSPAHRLMNASFVVQGALILAGALLLRPALRGTAARVATVLLGLAAAGVVVVGIFPRDGYAVAHAGGAVAHFVGGGVGLIALAYAVRRRSEVLGTVLALLGLVGTAMTVFFLAGVTEYLGVGGTERAAAYVIPMGLALAGGALWRLGAGPRTETETAAEDGDATRAGRREQRRLEREQARAQQAERNRERDAALEAAASRRAAGAGIDTGTGTDTDTDETYAEDPWASPGRRRRD